jgi:hypothetical protein
MTTTFVGPLPIALCQTIFPPDLDLAGRLFLIGRRKNLPAGRNPVDGRGNVLRTPAMSRTTTSGSLASGTVQHDFVITSKVAGGPLHFTVKMRADVDSWSVLDSRGEERLLCDCLFYPVSGRDFGLRSAANWLALFLSCNSLDTFRRPPVRLVAA